MGAFQVNRNKNKNGGNVYTREKKRRKALLSIRQSD